MLFLILLAIGLWIGMFVSAQDMDVNDPRDVIDEKVNNVIGFSAGVLICLLLLFLLNVIQTFIPTIKKFA